MNVYFNEFNLLMGSGGVTYLPLVSGILQSFAQKDSFLSSNCNFMPFVFRLDAPSEILRQYEKEPHVAAFSISMWNEKLSLHVAREIKKSYPDCLIIFGGAQCPHNSEQYLNDYDFIDVTVRAEGEIAFRDVLVRFLETRDFSGIANVSYRDYATGKYKINLENVAMEKNLDIFPSPYLTGVYDYLFLEKQHNYQMIVETNRGCPFLCTFCYWGRGGYTTKYRFHSLSRIHDEIEWAGRHKIPYIFNADSNFGMHKRDLKIAEMLVETKNLYGYPEKFRTCWGKNTDEKIFSVASFLHENGLDKGMTLGRQSNNKQVLLNIKRDNIKLEAFSSLQQQFNRRNVPIYAELILGLPGETLESWLTGIEEMLQTGLNNQLFVYPAEVYPNTELGEPAYQKRFGIKTQTIKLLEIHCSPRENNWIPEFQKIIVETASMAVDDWKRMMVISLITMLLHSMKLGFFLMWYLHKKHSVAYTDFFSFFVDKSTSKRFPIISGEVIEFFSYTENLLLGHGRGRLMLEYGDILWDVEEASFLRISEQLDEFYDELLELVVELLRDRQITFELDELLEVFKYQKSRIPRRIRNGDPELRFQLNVPEFFEMMFSNRFFELQKSNQTLKLEQRDYSGDKKSFARETVLWGRKSGTMCLSIDYAGCNWRPPSNIDQELSTTKVKKFDDLHSFEKFKSI